MAKKGWKAGLVASSVGLATSVLAVSGQTASAASSKPVIGGSINLDFATDIRDLDPALCYDTQSGEVVDQLYDQLVTWAPGGKVKVVPMAAQKYSVSKDGLTYTFHLHSGMKFWNGDPVTAQSFIDEFQRVLSKKVNSPGEGFFTIIKGATAYYNNKAKKISGLTAPNKTTLVIKLTKPEPFFLQILTMPFISAVDMPYINKVGKAFDKTKAMGSGPFELTSISPSSIVLSKNANYWRKDSYGNKLPYLSKVNITVSTNTQLDTMHFLRGQTAWIGWNIGGDGIPSSTYEQVVTNPTYKNQILKVTEGAVQYVGLNTTVGPTKNKLVRQAIEYALNKKQIIKLNNGRGVVANQPLPPSILGYVSKLPAGANYTYNVAKAKQLMAKAGYKSKTLKIDMYTQNTPDQLKFDAQVQSDLKKIGINVVLHSMTWASFLDKAESGKADMDWLGWVQDFPDASDFLNTLFNSNQIPLNNNMNYKNKQVDAWLNEAETDNNQAQRVSLYEKVTDQAMKDAVWVPMYYEQAAFATQPWVHGFYYPAVGQDPLEWVWVDSGH